MNPSIDRVLNRINQRIWWSALRGRIKDGLFEKLGLGLFSLLIALFGYKAKIIGGEESALSQIGEAKLIFAFICLIVFFIVWYVCQLIYFLAAPSEIVEFGNKYAYVKAKMDLYLKKDENEYAKSIVEWIRLDEKHLIPRIVCGILQLIGLISFLLASLTILTSVVQLFLGTRLLLPT